MQDHLYTIPVTEIFEQTGGCPICRLRDTLEKRVCDYTLGPAMMEPDVRQNTNRMGFCAVHLEQLRQGKNRLGLGLLLDTHLKELRKNLASGGLMDSPKKAAYKAARAEQSCFVCDRVEQGMRQLLSAMLKSYDTEPDFRQMFKAQQALCLPDYRLLLEQAAQQLPKKRQAEFLKDCRALVLKVLDPLCADMEKFTQMFDYRADKDAPEFQAVKDAIERAGGFLNGRIGTV